MSETYDVFEHSQEDGGYAGIRTFSDHSADSRNNPEVIAHGVTLEEAKKLASCTPEISRFTAVVEKAFCGGNSINPMILNQELFNALFAINEDRRLRDQHNLEPSGNFIVINPDDNDTLKNRIFKAILRTFPDPLGRVGNLEMAGRRFLIAVVSTH